MEHVANLEQTTLNVKSGDFDNALQFDIDEDALSELDKLSEEFVRIPRTQFSNIAFVDTGDEELDDKINSSIAENRKRGSAETVSTVFAQALKATAKLGKKGAEKLLAKEGTWKEGENSLEYQVYKNSDNAIFETNKIKRSAHRVKEAQRLLEKSLMAAGVDLSAGAFTKEMTEAFKNEDVQKASKFYSEARKDLYKKITSPNAQAMMSAIQDPAHIMSQNVRGDVKRVLDDSAKVSVGNTVVSQAVNEHGMDKGMMDRMNESMENFIDSIMATISSITNLFSRSPS